MLDGDELAAWPEAEVQQLVDLGLLAEAPLAAAVVCDGCEEECLEAVEWATHPTTGERSAFILCRDRDDIGRVAVPLSRLRRYTVDLPGLAQVLADALDTRSEPRELVAGRLWRLGSREAKQRRVDLFLARGMTWRDAGELFGACGAIAECSCPLLLVPHDLPAEPQVPPGARAQSLARLLSLADGQLELDTDELFAGLGPRPRVHVADLVPVSVPEGATWAQVHMEFMTDDHVRIVVGSTVENRSFKELGFRNRRKALPEPDGLWVLLVMLAKSGGHLDAKTAFRQNPEGWDATRRRVADLRKRIRAIFPGVEGDPFLPFAKDRGYQTRFVLSYPQRRL